MAATRARNPSAGLAGYSRRDRRRLRQQATGLLAPEDEDKQMLPQLETIERSVNRVSTLFRKDMFPARQADVDHVNSLDDLITDLWGLVGDYLGTASCLISLSPRWGGCCCRAGCRSCGTWYPVRQTMAMRWRLRRA